METAEVEFQMGGGNEQHHNLKEFVDLIMKMLIKSNEWKMEL